jgi:hypothetical protein
MANIAVALTPCSFRWNSAHAGSLQEENTVISLKQSVDTTFSIKKELSY